MAQRHKKQKSDKKILSKLREFCEIASMRCGCGNCDELVESVVQDGDIILKTAPKKYGIRDVDDWEEKMEKYEMWLFENRDKVLKEIPKIKRLWPHEAENIKEMLSEKQHECHHHDLPLDSDEFRRVMDDKDSAIVHVTFECCSKKCGQQGIHFHTFREDRA